MKRFSLLILLLAVLSWSMACGIFGRSEPEGPERLVPDSVLEMIVVDVNEAALSRTELPADLERDVASLEDFGDVARQARLSLSSGQVMITEGSLDFAGIREDLREQSYTNGAYRDFDILESADAAAGSALLEDERFLISGDYPALIDVLRDKSRDSGLFWNDGDDDLNRARDIAGDGLVVTASRNCQLDDNAGCEAVAWGFSRGEERRTVIEGSAALMFRDATAAQGAAAAIELSIGANDLMRLTEILTENATVTLKVDVNRDDFHMLQFPISLRQR